MPKTMKFKCFIIFFAVFIVIAKSDFDFNDCGSSMDIASVSVSNCSAMPCLFRTGNNYSVEITLSGVDSFDRTELVTEAFIWMFGTKWSLEVSPINPCSQWHCPVSSVNVLNYVADLRIAETLIKRPANVEVLITYDVDGTPFTAICVEFSVNLQ